MDIISETIQEPVTDRFGTYYYDDNGQYHREDGPALIDAINGKIYFYINGKFHFFADWLRETNCLDKNIVLKNLLLLMKNNPNCFSQAEDAVNYLKYYAHVDWPELNIIAKSLGMDQD